MHYITGTSFCVKPDPTRGFRSKENSFTANVLYTLCSIRKQDANLAYTFSCIDHTPVILFFESARIADMFIAKQRRENIPDYTNKVDNNDL
jgi:hypothetical protein